LHIYNSLSRQTEEFKPLVAGKISIYVCGITVYDVCHIGHGRVFVVFDMLTRYWRSRGYEVNYVRNITDIDDKIINRARETGEPFEEITQRFIAAMHQDEHALGVLPPDAEPRATAHIPQIITLIETLLAKDYAYIASNGDVYYHVERFERYGELANQDLEHLQAGARVEVSDVKHNPLDFVLWKLAKPDEPHWPSPWGEGRPGWHIECSAMSTELLGQPFDIHGGGADLIFPHHQNEVAQSEAAQGCRFVNVWMHNGHVQVDKEKMSKSLGNFFTIREVLQQYDAEIIRYFMIASHYRSPINYSEENLNSAKYALERLYTALRDLPIVDDVAMDSDSFEQRFYDAMDDDFNTPVALAVLFDVVREMNRLRDDDEMHSAAKLAVLLRRLASSLGLLYQDPAVFLQGKMPQQDHDHIEALIAERNVARDNKQWAKADELRDQLTALGVVLEDSADGTLWRRV